MSATNGMNDFNLWDSNLGAYPYNIRTAWSRKTLQNSTDNWDNWALHPVKLSHKRAQNSGIGISNTSVYPHPSLG